ncbi:MAG: DUF2975 domain-containing protein [bacterium]|nr:DUF2975 domain-containing protein [bacterium]
MSELRNYPVLKFLKGAVNFFWYVLLAALGIMAIIIVIALTPGFNDILPLNSFKAPVLFSYDGPVIRIESSNPDFNDVEVRVQAGELTMKASSIGFWLMVSEAMLIWILVGMFILFNIRKIINNLTKAHPFEIENVKRLRIIGYTLIAGEIINWLLFFIMNLIYSDDFSVYAGDIYFGLDKNITIIFVGLVILVISEIFRVGFDMRKEQELTI